MSTKPPTRPAIPAETERIILVEAGHRCAVCGETCPVERAHIIPWSESKDHSAENLICLCANCHQRADSEKWGAKTLHEYKLLPWIKRRFADEKKLPNGSTTALVELKIAKSFENYGETEKRLLVYALAAFLDMSPGDVRLVSVERGSVIVTIELPADKATVLLVQAKEKNVKLMELLIPLLVEGLRKIEKKNLASEIQTTAKPNTRSLEQSKGGPSKLFVGNLSFETTENDLNDAFAAFGTVTETNLMMDRMTNRPRGFGFVTMSSAEEAQKAIEAMQGLEVKGRLITVKKVPPTKIGGDSKTDPHKHSL